MELLYGAVTAPAAAAAFLAACAAALLMAWRGDRRAHRADAAYGTCDGCGGVFGVDVDALERAAITADWEGLQ